MPSANQTSSLVSSGSIVAEPGPETDFFPNSGNLYPKYADKFPRTAVEVWLFDALAPDGSDAFTVSFLRDSMAAPAGFRVIINASWEDGTNWSHDLILPMSTVTVEGSNPGQGRVTGVWRTADDGEDGPSASFEVNEDLSISKVTFNVPGRIMGTLTHKSMGYPCLPKTEDEAKVATEIFWMRPVAMASANLDVAIVTDPSTEPKRMLISADKGGYGGLERSWESIPWAKAVTDSLFVRAKVGPYVLQVMRLVGRPENNYEHTASARLYCDGKLVCSPQRVVDKPDGYTFGDSKAGHAVIVDKFFDGEGVPATFRHKNVGYRIEFLSEAKWSFELRHDRVWWQMPTSKPGPNTTGSSAFVVSVKGGLVGSGDIFEGFGMAGQVEMPEDRFFTNTAALFLCVYRVVHNVFCLFPCFVCLDLLWRKPDRRGRRSWTLSGLEGDTASKRMLYLCFGVQHYCVNNVVVSLLMSSAPVVERFALRVG
ncbi:hypothetical protein K505DRAFT_418755 [Melanomma pulvis-pyrius CBS 109.77]|uniref:Uncharacterized protein n=1 Tax=Melanomma pulvis-pyrius CBS 109.77 TaxID=1314802 RepID=A0A6A6X6L9_9PLEO|nr:hypothetical protein K505DRAFT_418755 [Melanomma pulvis-pyrius CBS 109.77]